MFIFTMRNIFVTLMSSPGVDENLDLEIPSNYCSETRSVLLEPANGAHKLIQVHPSLKCQASPFFHRFRVQSTLFSRHMPVLYKIQLPKIPLCDLSVCLFYPNGIF